MVQVILFMDYLLYLYLLVLIQYLIRNYNVKYNISKAYFKKTPWANENLKKLFNLKENFGEAWLISAVNNCESIVKDYDLILSEFIKKYPNFFALTRQESENFIYPNLTKILDAKYPLSIQVHPDDRYAKQFNSLGKDECWYVLKTSYEPFILGSKTLDINIIKDTINTDQIEQYLNKIKLNEGDFVYIEAVLNSRNTFWNYGLWITTI
ncbi:hypothetical protein ONA23_01155 [Mycoplasmopsis cynos]|uniref:type I phosphomannose isomerase catalytic subunit n=1 Tax=Mycoplasmopsis cynos TaxID=171284 RepID=UPI0024C60092|nr:type I phosphomannose isomerase catalytic subunit [Mycoplasmopsis cynos]WAM06846.1 hypothetical protein ONA23_01155 [Mycoplasmopsis cynos]